MTTPVFTAGFDKTYVKLDQAALRKMLQGEDGPAAKFLETIAIQLESNIKRDLSKAGTGRSYKRTKAGLRHVASAPGHAPAVDMGRLRSSITHEIGKDSTSLVARVGTDVKYSIYLEYGTRRMQPRPFLRPALDNMARKHIKVTL